MMKLIKSIGTKMNADRILYVVGAIYFVIIVGTLAYSNFSDRGKLCKSLGGSMYREGCAKTTVTLIPLKEAK
jgi:hypothetical protein